MTSSLCTYNVYMYMYMYSTYCTCMSITCSQWTLLTVSTGSGGTGLLDSPLTSTRLVDIQPGVRPSPFPTPHSHRSHLPHSHHLPHSLSNHSSFSLIGNGASGAFVPYRRSPPAGDGNGGGPEVYIVHVQYVHFVCAYMYIHVHVKGCGDAVCDPTLMTFSPSSE